MVSHELRSPLNAILGWTSLWRSRQYDQSPTTRALETIERSVRNQRCLIEDLIIRGQMLLEVCPVDLIEVIQAVITTIQPAATAKNIRLQTLEPVARDVAGDRERLNKLFGTCYLTLLNSLQKTERSRSLPQAFQFAY